MATWPTTLPAPKKEGYSLRPFDQTLRTDMEVGPARVRRTTTVRNDTITLSWVMTDAQFLAFRSWFENGSTGLAGGVEWFTGLELATGSGIQTSLECRFVGTYEATLMQSVMRWSVTGSVEVR
jgi:hypothetical protein